MSTAGLMGFVLDNVEKLTYNHSDSYPEGLGLDVLSFARAMPEHTRRLVRDLQMLTSGSPPPTPEDITFLQPFTDLNVSSQSTSDWYCLLRNTQGNLAASLEAGYMEDGATFAADSLSCEWGYVIDLDSMMLDVYQGFQTQAHDSGRFAQLPPLAGYSDTYYPLRRICSYDLTQLPTDEAFLADTST